MEIDQDVILKIIQATGLRYSMHVDGKVFSLDDVSIEKSKIPVRKPTTRGGVYFTDTTAYKIKASTGDMSILLLLPKIMLGPNTEFRPVEVRTNLILGNENKDITLVSHISNTVNTKTRVDLNMIVDRISL